MSSGGASAALLTLLAPPTCPADSNGTADALTTAAISPAQAAACNDTVLAFLQGRPELSTLVCHLESAGGPRVGLDWLGSGLPLWRGWVVDSASAATEHT